MAGAASELTDLENLKLRQAQQATEAQHKKKIDSHQTARRTPSKTKITAKYTNQDKKTVSWAGMTYNTFAKDLITVHQTTFTMAYVHECMSYPLVGHEARTGSLPLKSGRHVTK